MDVEKIKRDMQDIVVKTLLSVEAQIYEMSRANVSNRYSCYELFGFDVLLDSSFKPWLLEVNISPSLHSTSSLDLSVKVHNNRTLKNFHFDLYFIPGSTSTRGVKHGAFPFTRQLE